MNLAEAIRRAASGANPNVVVQASVAPAHDVTVHQTSFAPPPHGTEPNEAQAESETEIHVASTLNAAESHAVRFDLILSPEQLYALFKGVADAERSVLTLREAARYLRIPSRTLEEMAQLGQIPAFLIDGKWRFARNNVDEWLAQGSFRKEMEA